MCFETIYLFVPEGSMASYLEKPGIHWGLRAHL